MVEVYIGPSGTIGTILGILIITILFTLTEDGVLVSTVLGIGEIAMLTPITTMDMRITIGAGMVMDITKTPILDISMAMEDV